eukprot:5243599-Pyramimonas_sp.AAC.1
MVFFIVRQNILRPSHRASSGPQNGSKYPPVIAKSGRSALRVPWWPGVESTSQRRARVNVGLEILPCERSGGGPSKLLLKLR